MGGWAGGRLEAAGSPWDMSLGQGQAEPYFWNGLGATKWHSTEWSER